MVSKRVPAAVAAALMARAVVPSPAWAGRLSPSVAEPVDREVQDEGALVLTDAEMDGISGGQSQMWMWVVCYGTGFSNPMWYSFGALFAYGCAADDIMSTLSEYYTERVATDIEYVLRTLEPGWRSSHRYIENVTVRGNCWYNGPTYAADCQYPTFIGSPTYSVEVSGYPESFFCRTLGCMCQTGGDCWEGFCALTAGGEWGVCSG